MATSELSEWVEWEEWKESAKERLSAALRRSEAVAKRSVRRAVGAIFRAVVRAPVLLWTALVTVTSGIKNWVVSEPGFLERQVARFIVYGGTLLLILWSIGIVRLTGLSL